ncbi:MAG TPA: hypothetical protein PK210_11800 [Bacteroidia bacterium]|nr:hypothetical protein [Bacteroidia bacterium]
MTRQEEIVQRIVSKIDSAIDDFNEGIPSVQREIDSEIRLLIKSLDMNGKFIKNSVQNIRLLSKLRSKIESIVLNDSYKKKVEQFAQTFNTVATLQNLYFTSLDKRFTPNKILGAIKEDAISATVRSLTEGGINANLTSGIEDILRTYIRNGGEYVDLVDRMKTFISGNNNVPGYLTRYARQVTIDSIQQYNAAYNHAISAELDYEWYMYIGSNITTTREFCQKMTKKKYFHKSELPEILKGRIDGQQVRINPKTDLWYGAYEDTSEKNFNDRRGGYQCRHQIYAVASTIVPIELKQAI